MNKKRHDFSRTVTVLDQYSSRMLMSQEYSNEILNEINLTSRNSSCWLKYLATELHKDIVSHIFEYR